MGSNSPILLILTTVQGEVCRFLLIIITVQGEVTVQPPYTHHGPRGINVPILFIGTTFKWELPSDSPYIHHCPRGSNSPDLCIHTTVKGEVTVPFFLYPTRFKVK